jgi:hypothetical protein
MASLAKPLRKPCGSSGDAFSVCVGADEVTGKGSFLLVLIDNFAAAKN